LLKTVVEWYLVIVVNRSLIQGDSKSTKNVWCLCCNQERVSFLCLC